MTNLRNTFPVIAIAVLSLAAAACKGPGQSIAPGGFAPLSPGGTPHAQYVMVGDSGAGCSAGANSTVLTFSLGSNTTIASGNLVPVKTLGPGSNTGLNSPTMGDVDQNSMEWVTNQFGHNVTEYAALAYGNIFPTRNISGPATTLLLPASNTITENSSGATNYVYVTDYSSNAIDVFAGSANGNVPPLYQIKGVATMLSNPWGIRLDASGHIWVGNWNGGTGGTVLEFASPIGGPTYPATQNNAPIATLGPGGASTLVAPTDIYFDSQKNLWVADWSNHAVDEFAAGNLTGAPMRTIAVPSSPGGIAVDNGGNVYVTPGYGAAIWIWPASALNLGSNTGPPPLTISGPSTKLQCTLGVRVFSTGNDV